MEVQQSLSTPNEPQHSAPCVGATLLLSLYFTYKFSNGRYSSGNE